MTTEKRQEAEDVPGVDGLTPRQERGIIALLSEPTIAKAAGVVGVTEQTVHRWFKDPKFDAAYRAARREAFSHAIAMTQKLAPVAVNTLAKLMTDPESPPHVRQSAASSILKFGREGIELDDLSARMEALELAAKRQEQAGRN